LDLDIDAIDFESIRPETFALARRHQLTTFDAVYVELALRSKVPLATRNEALAAAARKAGAALFEAS
jgi:predicted nucleic acid-binding protein